MLLLGLCLLGTAMAQFPGMGKKEEKKAPVNKDDLKYIRCATCEAVVRQSIKANRTLKEESNAKKRVGGTCALPLPASLLVIWHPP